MNDIDVTVIMPSLNVCQYIEECLDSVIHQTMKNIEIICVDAGSTDGTIELIKNYAEKDNRIRIINSIKKSYGFQVNEGIRNARGKYIGIVETDDFVDPNMYEKLYECALKNDADMVKADFNKFVSDDNSNYIYDSFKICSDNAYYNRVVFDESLFLLRKTKNYIWSGIYKRDFLLDNKLFLNETPGASYQDNGFWFLTTVMAKTVYFLSEVFYHLRRDNPNSSFFSKAKEFCMCDEYRYIRNYLEAHSLFSTYSALYWRALFYNYMFTLNRVSFDRKKGFLEKFSEDLKDGYEKKQIDFSMFSFREKHDIINIVNHPDQYYIHSVVNTSKKEDGFINRFIQYAKDYGYFQAFLYIADYIKYKINNLINKNRKKKIV